MFRKLFNNLRPAVFNYKENPQLGLSSEKTVIGVMAQDIVEGLRLSGVNPDDFSIVTRDEYGFYKVDYSQLIPILISEIRELKNEIQNLKGS